MAKTALDRRDPGMFPVTRRWSAATSASHRTPQPGCSRCGCGTWPGEDRTSLRRLGWRRSTCLGGRLRAPTSNWSAKSRRTLPARQPWVRRADHIRRNGETSRSIAFRDAEAAGWPKSICAPVVVQDSSLGRHAAVPAVSVNWAEDPAASGQFCACPSSIGACVSRGESHPVRCRARSRGCRWRPCEKAAYLVRGT